MEARPPGNGKAWRSGEFDLLSSVVGEPCVNQSIQAYALLGRPHGEGTVHFVEELAL